jgi:hypothetical protein
LRSMADKNKDAGRISLPGVFLLRRTPDAF